MEEAGVEEDEEEEAVLAEERGVRRRTSPVGGAADKDTIPVIVLHR